MAAASVVTESTPVEDHQREPNPHRPFSPLIGRLAALLDVQAVADLLSCSTRHVYRLSDAGRMPSPVKLGALVRWPRHAIEHWLTDGCPTCRKSCR